jgi:hypothetical protein
MNDQVSAVQRIGGERIDALGNDTFAAKAVDEAALARAS